MRECPRYTYNCSPCRLVALRCDNRPPGLNVEGPAPNRGSNQVRLQHKSITSSRTLSYVLIKSALSLEGSSMSTTAYHDISKEADTNQMVTRAYYENQEPVYGHHGGRGYGYPLSHDRDLPASSGPYGGSRNHQLSLQESHASSKAPDRDSASSHPRRRIPVAVSSTPNI
jgi:hypothetical protein